MGSKYARYYHFNKSLDSYSAREIVLPLAFAAWTVYEAICTCGCCR